MMTAQSDLDLNMIHEVSANAVEIFDMVVPARNVMVADYPQHFESTDYTVPMYFEVMGQKRYYVVALWPDHAEITTSGIKSATEMSLTVRDQQALESSLRGILDDVSTI